MHLDSLKVKNFRILEDVEIEKLGHVNLIVGKNNSGKSTVLEALMLLAGNFNRESILDVAYARGNVRYRSNAGHEWIDVENFFPENSPTSTENNKLFIGANKYELAVLYKKNILRINNEHVIELDEGHLHTHLVSSTQQVPYGFIASQIADINLLAKEFDQLVFTEAEQHIIRALRIIDSRISQIAFLSDSFIYDRLSSQKKVEIRVPYVKLEGYEKRVPLHSMGEGIIRLLQIIIRLFKAKDGFLLIDEFENGLHYSTQDKAWELIFELSSLFNIQIFATTHSWDCIESFAKVAKERQDLQGVLVRMGQSVRKSNKGKIIATVFDEDELYNLTKDRIEVR